MLFRLIDQTRLVKKNVESFIRPANITDRQTFGYIISLFGQFRVCSIGNQEKRLRTHFTLRSFKHVKTSLSNSRNRALYFLLEG